MLYDKNTNLVTLERIARAQCSKILAIHVSMKETIEQEKKREDYAKLGVSALSSLLSETQRKLLQIQPSVDLKYNNIKDAHELQSRRFKCILDAELQQAHKCIFSNKKECVLELSDCEKALQKELNALNHEISNGIRVFKHLTYSKSKKSTLKATGRSKSIPRESPLCKRKRSSSLPWNSKLESLIETSDTVDLESNQSEQNHDSEQYLSDGVFNLHLQNFLFLF